MHSGFASGTELSESDLKGSLGRFLGGLRWELVQNRWGEGAICNSILSLQLRTISTWD